MNVSELQFLGWGSEKNKIYNLDEMRRNAKVIGGEKILENNLTFEYRIFLEKV